MDCFMIQLNEISFRFPYGQGSMMIIGEMLVFVPKLITLRVNTKQSLKQISAYGGPNPTCGVREY